MQVEKLDAAGLKRDLSELRGLSENFGRSLSFALARAVVDARSLSDVLRGLALSLSRRALAGAIEDLGGVLAGAARPSPAAGAPMAGRAMQVNVNVAGEASAMPNRSERQIARSILRALQRGQGGM